LRLLFWDGAKAIVGSHVLCEGQTYTPAAIDPSILQVLTLPTGITSCGAPPDDPHLQAQVLEFLRTQDKEIRSAAWLDLNVVIVEAILAFVHEGKENSVYVAETAEAAEMIFQGRGEPRKLEPRAVGERLGPLGLSTDLLREEPCKECYLAPGIDLLGLETFQRDCAFCKNID
jgi:hypothetical protein